MAMTWSVLAIEAVIAISALLTRKVRFAAVVMALALHAGIMLAMGLMSFGLTMIAIVVVLCLGDRQDPPGIGSAAWRRGNARRVHVPADRYTDNLTGAGGH